MNGVFVLAPSRTGKIPSSYFVGFTSILVMSINFEFNAVGIGFSLQVPSIHTLAELCVAVMMAL